MSTFTKVDIEVNILKLFSKSDQKSQVDSRQPLEPGIFNKISYFWEEMALKWNV